MTDMTKYRNLIAGELRAPLTGRYLDAENPATGEIWAQIPSSDARDVNAAVDAAAAALPSWSLLPAAKRAAYLTQVAELFKSHGEELARLETQDNGRILAENRAGNTAGMHHMWTLAARDTADAVTGTTVVLGPNSFGVTRRVPYGVIGAVTPWNAPIPMLSSKAAFAIAAGNTVVVKPAEQASVSVLRLGELLADVLPPGVINIVCGLGPDVGDPLVRHPAVKKVSMTGSSDTARAIQRSGADTLTPSIFELGGKSPNIVFADADLDAAAIGVTTSSVFSGNAGQVCVAGTRILIQRPVLDEMLARMEKLAEQVVIGDPMNSKTTMGPIISRSQYDRVLRYLELGRAEAKLVFGGRHGAAVVPALPAGYWIEPTLFLTTDNSLRICQDEIFGPVATVIPFDTDDEALAIANDSRYGLASGVWTRDLGRAHRFIRDLEAGNVWVNTYRQTGRELPFGGVKDSGYGHDSVFEYTREKSAVITSPD
jgi:aldehyde dehydrogenase (NAD+)